MPNALGRSRDIVFFASGFAGLIYESIWAQYLKLFLGHAAYAQTLVLAIFMGGMAIGAALAARFARRITTPLLTYALIELAIGILAIAFHPVFIGATEGFYDAVFGHHLGGLSLVLIKWGLAASLILPQSILLGATFPVFASAATRAARTGEGRPIATLYFANSLGGSFGVLASGFLLIPVFGLPGTIVTAGVVNLVIAAFVTLRLKTASHPAADTADPMDPVVPGETPDGALAKAGAQPVHGSKKRRRDKRAAAGVRNAGREASAKRGGSALGQPPGSARADTPGFVAATTVTVAPRLLLAVSFLTGASSFIYEIGWVRMLSLVLGSATHSFELMLSSFIFGLALGGLWIRSRIDSARNPGVLLGHIQIAMGAAALATVPLHNATFDLVAVALSEIPKTDGGYAVFNLLRYGIASLIMFPAAFCAGMTLPLATRLLFAMPNQGERAIGLVYSANTLGAIGGLAFAVHFGLPIVGLEYLVASGAVIDVLLGAALLAVFGGRARILQAVVAIVASIAGAAAAAATFDAQKIASGVYRSGLARTRATVIEIAHGKTATISVETDRDLMTIKTNGKPDASANLRVPTAYPQDEVTARLLGIIPLMMHANPKRVANIGLGSGVTGEMILADPRVSVLDTIEIEPKVVDLARRFGELNRSVYQDPRSAIHIDDAKAFFASRGNRYDLIISEPSNPWVSGVAGLFTVEFYLHVSRYLDDGGLFAQWMHTYEIHPDRVVSVLKAMDAVFDDFLVVALDEGDVLFVGTRNGKVAMPPDSHARLSQVLKRALRNIHIANQADITFRVIGNKAMFKPWLDARHSPTNSDYAPYLDTHADSDRFLKAGGADFYWFALSALPIPEILGGRGPLPTPSALSFNLQFGPEPVWLAARQLKGALLGPDAGPDVLPLPGGMPANLADQGRRILGQCLNPPSGDNAFAVARFGTRVLPYLSPVEGRDVLAAVDRGPCFTSLDGAQQQWPVLLRQVAERNPRAFGPTALQMLESGQGTTAVRARYLLGLAMLGLIGAGEPARADAAWQKHGHAAFGEETPDLTYELLRAHAMAK